MFDLLEVRKVENGFILVVQSEDGSKEYVYDTSRKVLKIVREYLENKQK